MESDHEPQVWVLNPSFSVLVSTAWGQISPPSGAGQAPPAWLENINPADYMLLAGDLNPPFQMEGEISSQAEAMEMSLGTGEGAVVQKVNAFSTKEEISVRKEGCPTSSVEIQAEVFETPEMAASARPIPTGSLKEEKDWWDPSAFRDSRLGGGLGEANARFSNVQWMVFVNDEGKWQEGPALQELQIRYKNIVASFYPLMWTGANDWGFEHYDTCGMTVEVARLWLDKVSGIEPAGQVDLQLSPKSIFLTYFGDNNFLPLEEAADKQAVAVWVTNQGKIPAKNVHFQLYLQASGSEDYQPIGEPVLIGDIAPGENASGNALWDLQGKNVEGASLLAQAYIPGENDSNPEDNSAAIKVNIYYAHNAQRAYLDYFKFSYYY